jgi:CHASE3 domain sensor protein
MRLSLRQAIRVRQLAIVMAALLTIFVLDHASLADQGHVVSRADLQKAVESSSHSRQHDIETVRQFLSSPTADEAIKSAKLDPQQVRTAVATLSDEDLAQLAARANKAQADFAAGGISVITLGIIVVLVVFIILFLTSRIPI